MPTGLPQIILSPQPLHIALYVTMDDLSNKVMHDFQDQFHFLFSFIALERDLPDQRPDWHTLRFSI